MSPGFFDEEGEAKRAWDMLWAGGAANTARSVEILESLLRRNPAHAYRWCDHGEALLRQGRDRDARYCFTRAAELAPNVAPVLLRAANFHFRRGENRQAMEYCSRILGKIRDYDGVIFSTYMAVGIGVDEILAKGIPEDRGAARAFLSYLIRKDAVENATGVWEWTAARSFADDHLAAGYSNMLFRNGRYAESVAQWAKFFDGRAAGYPAKNAVFNGGFEFEPSGSRLDWTAGKRDGVEVERDSATVHSGAWSLRIRFEAKDNVAYQHVRQAAVVKPGFYVFRSWMKTEDVTTDQGVGFRIVDIESETRLDVSTPPQTGTRGWILVEKSLAVPRGTSALEIQVTRSPSRRLDNKIRGTVWIDDVALLPVPQGDG